MTRAELIERLAARFPQLVAKDADLAAKSSGDPKLILTKTITEIVSGAVYHAEEAAVI